MTWLMTNLEQRFAAVAEALHPHPPERPPPGQTPNNIPPPQTFPPGQFHLPPQITFLFDSRDPHNFYFVVFRGGEIYAQTTNAQAYIYSGERPQHYPRMFDIARPLPSGEFVTVGCSTEPEFQELKSAAWKLTIAGAVILVFGLAGGWWFVSRALRPIENISAAAAKISAGDLSQRINTAETESELGKLASVLNSTFARLDAAFAQQKQFASDAAHELRTPVSVMLTQTQTSLNRERSPAEYRETLEACQRAAQRMRKLIGVLLELARLDAGQEPMKRMKFDLSRTAQDCVELIRPLADERQVKVNSELPPLEITGDSGRIAQVITNLLTNAIQYNNPDGEVRITAHLQAGAAILTVRDNGAGIAAEDLPRVFERFYRADKSRSSGNNGLGLAISKAIVDAHGGAIEVSSTENVGTIFTVRLPV